MQTPASGTTVGGKYRILRVLGQGGMGAVFEAENTLTLKRAAIKWLHPRHIGRESSRARLLQEARATSRIRHRNVVDLYDVVEEDQAIFLVMELLTGELLSQRIAREPLAMHTFMGLLLQAMEGVAASHEAGVVHRDIKPENIFLAATPSGALPKIIDFGISKVVDPDFARLTRSGVAIGTPRYASFEQVRGERDVDARSDIYAFGVILYEALVGRGPYNATTFGEQAVQFITTPPLPVRTLRPEVPLELEAVVQHALARDREERIPTMRALIDALRPFASEASFPTPLSVLRPGDELLLPGAVGRGVATQPGASLSPIVQSAPASQAPPIRRGRAWLLASATALLALLALFAARRSDGAARAPEVVSSALPAASAPVAEIAVTKAESLSLDAGPWGAASSVAPHAPRDPEPDGLQGVLHAPSQTARPRASRLLPPRPRKVEPRLPAVAPEPASVSVADAGQERPSEGEPERAPARAGAIRRDEF